jgi:16S rRNA (uracil1498-N3)-methyltransferase
MGPGSTGGPSAAPSAAPSDAPSASPDPALVAAAALVFVDDPAAPVLTESDAHHLLDVLRLRAGEVVAASDGAGRWTTCRLALGPTGGGRGAGWPTLEVEGPVRTQPRESPEVTVAFAPVKGDRPEWVVQKLTELGVDRIVPVRAVRSVVRWEGERGDRVVDRLRRVAHQAAAQSRRPWLPEVAGVTTLDGLLALTGHQPLLAHFGGGRPTLDAPVVAVGPEGGWDESERDRRTLVGLGPTVLRAETAAVAAGALLCGLRSGVVGTLA